MRGFTLVEALVALVVLTVAVGPAFALAAASLRVSTSLKNTLIATNLAEEGLEVVRAVRDDNWFANAPFESGLDACSAGCSVSWGTGADPTQGIGAQQSIPLRLDPATGLYGYGPGADSPFRRTITITPKPAGAPVELSVISDVQWTERGSVRHVTLESHLFNWK